MAWRTFFKKILVSMNKSTQLRGNLGKILPRKNKIRVLITAGPTRAYFDAIRYLTNYSTGELGYQISRALLKEGVEVIAVTGPTKHPFSKLPLTKLIEIETNDQMYEAVITECRKFRPNFAIFTAAVLDFKPEKILPGKTSSNKPIWRIRLIPTAKIVDEVGKLFPHIKRIGFKLDYEPCPTQEIKKHGITLLNKKKYYALVLNFFPQITKKAHPAWLFTSGTVKKCEGKTNIAKQLARLIIGSRKD
ncbi:MAG: hypothetical protein EB078_02210 [Proteobacteria bacterium]|nr:hypothetical protein [Pseudomonadota bacterium]NDC23560.1 hypothetical protein [Pseudomonadota bacterium]NDD03695.1 hypothetical protein [Pseudomonadota bacterium]NDG26215.1 hypothetical protein [Pseudomonadota bacterium]